MALQYPILFPYGDNGYQLGMKFRDASSGYRGKRSEVSMMEFYGYYQHYRPGEPNPILCSGRLSQQYGVNAYSCVEANRLSFHFFNQKLLRSETYQGISDALSQGAATGRDVGGKDNAASFLPREQAKSKSKLS
jgi:hypothetical protein